MNSRGPRTEPWGTPCVTGMVLDVQLLMEMKWNLSERYELNQESAEPVMPMDDCRRLRSMVWLMVSKAALRSRRRRMVSEPESDASRRSLVTLRRAVSVLW